MEEDKLLLPHHLQQPLCTTRLPYRQGRELTAVKVYTVTRESNHLLIFGVPSISLRQEIKAQFAKFGKLILFNVSKDHPGEVFTETYHAQYEKIQSSRLAKRVLDTKNFYGGLLHVTYAPEMESIDETRSKLLQRQQNVLYRLRNLEKEKEIVKTVPEIVPKTTTEPEIKMNMGEHNTIFIGPQLKKNKLSKKRKAENKKVNTKRNVKVKPIVDNITNCPQVIDCTNVETEVISNIDEALNYNKFGSEIVKKVPSKPLNKIQIHLNKKS